MEKTNNMISAKLLSFVAAGGAIGAVGRYVVSAQLAAVLGDRFPFATLSVNVIGAIVMGTLVAAMSSFWTPTLEVRNFLLVGVLGGFTTFSLFSHDMVTLIDRGDHFGAGIYAAASVFFCVIGYFVGHSLFRQLAG